MDRSDVIQLVREETYKDDYGVTRTRTKLSPAYARVDSVTASEFFDGGRNGLNPEFRMRMFAGDYHGEQIVEYRGKAYAVYRTYKAGTDVIELYVERKGGTNGKTDRSRP